MERFFTTPAEPRVMTVDEHAEELASALGVDKEEVSRDLENLLAYSVPIEEAKQSLRRKYGDASAGTGGDPEPMAIGEVTTDAANVTVTAVVLTVGKRSIRYRDEDRVIFEGELADETGTISYTAWSDFELAPGDAVLIQNAGVREWEGAPELNLGDSTMVAPAEDRPSIDVEPGGDTALANLRPGDRGRNVEVQVVEAESKVIDGRDGETEILSGVLADDTARLPFTDWDPHSSIDPGATLRLSNVYIREFRGVPSVNLTEFSTVEPVDASIAPPEATRLSIREAVATGGAYDVEVEGHVVGVREGSGLIQRCPECRRVVQNGQCRSHGAVDPVDDLRTKAILDDGTGTLTVVLDESITADVYGGSLEEALDRAREAMDQEVVADAIRDRLVGRAYLARGVLSVDDYGASLTAGSFEPVADDPAERARALLEAVQ